MKKLLMLLGFGFTTIIAFSQSTDSTLTAFEGKYTFPSGSIVPEISIVLDGTTLTMNANIGSSSLERKEGDLFAVSQFQGTALFTRDANKKVIGVVIDAMGYHLEGTKGASGIFEFKVVKKYPIKKLYWAK